MQIKLQELHGWVAEQLGVHTEHLRFTSISGDASPRIYFRVTPLSIDSAVFGAPFGVCSDNELPTIGAASAIAAYAPASENNDAFIKVQTIMATAGVAVPALYSNEIEKGFFLMEDLGDVLLADNLTNASADAMYERALKILHRFVGGAITSVPLPVFDDERIHNELAVFPEWFLTKLLGLSPASLPRKLLAKLAELLLQSFQEQPRCLVHRDFHSRNLMCTGPESLAVIDFQDAVIGPITYDPVSLLKDCYVQWHRKDQLRWLEQHRLRLIALGVPVIDQNNFIRSYDLVGLQRHLRVLGVFARLHLRDGKHSYLADLPLVVFYVLEVLELYSRNPVFAAFDDWMRSEVMPLLVQAPWWSEHVPSSPIVRP